MPIQKLPSYYRKLQACQIDEECVALIAEFTFEFGISGFIFADIVNEKNFGIENIRLTNWDSDWISFYIDHKCILHDPIIKYIRSPKRIFTWSEACSARPLDHDEQFVMQEATARGFSGGIAVPFFRPDGSVTCASYISDGRKLNNGERDYLYFLTCTTINFLDEFRSKRLNPCAATKIQRELSQKEVECLYLVSQGHNSKEIASHFGISPRTIDQYIGSASMKLNARNRTQAVIIAKQRRVI